MAILHRIHLDNGKEISGIITVTKIKDCSIPLNFAGGVSVNIKFSLN